MPSGRPDFLYVALERFTGVCTQVLYSLSGTIGSTRLGPSDVEAATLDTLDGSRAQVG